MTQYFKMESDNFLDYGLTKSPSLAEHSILGGKVISPEQLPPLVFEVNFPNDVHMPHFLTGGSVLVSKLFISVLTSVGVNNFQSFPVVITNPETGKKWNDYFLFNVLGKIKAANLVKSQYSELMPASADGVDVPLLAFKEIVLDVDKTLGELMFRLAEDSTALIVHERIVDTLSDSRPDGGWGIDVIELDNA